MRAGSWAGALVVVLLTFAVFGNLTGIVREAADQPLKLFDVSTELIASARPAQSLLILAPLLAGLVAGLISRSITEGGRAPLRGYSVAMLLWWIFIILQTGMKEILFTILIYPSFLLVYATVVVNAMGLAGIVSASAATLPVPVSTIAKFVLIEIVFCIIYAALGAVGGLAGKLVRGKKKEQKQEEKKT